MLERITPQWLAGFFDGEGSIVLMNWRGQVKVAASIGQKDLSLLMAIRSKYPEFRKPTFNSNDTKGCWFIRANGRKAKRFLEDIAPYVIRKRTQVELALEFIETVKWACGRKKLEAINTKQLGIAA